MLCLHVGINRGMIFPFFDEGKISRIRNILMKFVPKTPGLFPGRADDLR